jgi:serine/threonine-protein kinase HipA
MKYCPITYESIADNMLYSKKGLYLLSSKLQTLKVLPFTAEQQRSEARTRAGKMSVQGVQSKFGAILNIKESCFEIVDFNGVYLLKPQHDYYESLPENEAITMTLARLIGLDVPLHGLVYSIDNSLTYFIKRFDRDKKQKFALEDFAQLTLHSRETKYNGSVEQVIKVIEENCTFPSLEKAKLFKLTLFNFLTGNEDMHLKNYSLITKNNIVSLSPCYDLINTTIAQPDTKEELALPLRGKKHNLQINDFVAYFAQERLGLSQQIIHRIISEFSTTLPLWRRFISISFLNQQLQEQYLQLLNERAEKLRL